MNNIAFFLTSLSGFSTLLGLIPIYFNVGEEHRLICSSLAFASGVMFSISIFDLIPESFSILEYSKYSILIVFLFFILGIFISFGLDNLFNNLDNSLYKVGIISMIGLVIHNIPEGIITFVSTSLDYRLGISVCISIILHNIPEGISIGIPIYYSTESKYKAFIYTLIASFSELLGGVLTYLFLIKFVNFFALSILFSLISGLMVYISLFELLRESFYFRYKYYTIIFFLIGVFIMFINLLLL